MKLADAVTIDDIRAMAARRLPRTIFDVIDGGSGDELTLRANRNALDRIVFRPRPLADVRERDLSTTVFGQRISLPVILGPTGSARLAGADAELTVARAAGRAGTIFTYGTVASYTLEDVARAATGGPLWFQLYMPPDRDAARRLVARVRDAGYKALLLTIDTPVRGNHDRDARNRFTTPFRVRPRLVAEGLSRPRWSMQFLLDNAGTKRIPPGNPVYTGAKPRKLSLRQVESSLMGVRWPVTWDDLEYLRTLWDGPLLVKGLMRADECKRLAGMGVDGVVVSNHGGRQLDSLPATIDVLPAIVDACAGQMDVLVDSGFRRGIDVLKALALGAKACLLGRPYIYGLAAGGEAGVSRVIEIFRSEIDRAMALLGCSSVAELDPTFVEGFRPADTGPPVGL